MNNILKKYGIKEVADVTFYQIDREGKPTKPVLYFDTLKVSSNELSSEFTTAVGGKGNPSLIVWDYNKEINVTLEDALFSTKSLSLLFNSKIEDTKEILKIVPRVLVENGKVRIDEKWIEIPADAEYFYADGNIATKDDYEYVTFELAVEGKKITISANTFPGIYYVIGETKARDETTGIDTFFKFVIPKAKLLSNTTFTMEGNGEPTTISLDLKVLSSEKSEMMKLVRCDLRGPIPFLTSAELWEEMASTLKYNYGSEVEWNAIAEEVDWDETVLTDEYGEIYAPKDAVGIMEPLDFWVPETWMAQISDDLSIVATQDASLMSNSVDQETLNSLKSEAVSQEIHPTQSGSARPHKYNPDVYYLQKDNTNAYVYLHRQFEHSEADGGNISVSEASISIRAESPRKVYYSGCTTHFTDNYIPSQYQSIDISYICWQCLYGSLEQFLISSTDNTISTDEIANAGFETMNYNGTTYYKIAKTSDY